MSDTKTDWVYSWCQGADERICDFCQRHTPPPDDCYPVQDFPVPVLVQHDRCMAFVLRPDVRRPDSRRARLISWLGRILRPG